MKILNVRRRLVLSVQCAVLSVQCVVSRKRIVGLPFFEEKIGVKKYQNIVAQLLTQLEENERDFSFYKDWAKAHTAKATTDFMQEFFCDGLVRSGF